MRLFRTKQSSPLFAPPHIHVTFMSRLHASTSHGSSRHSDNDLNVGRPMAFLNHVCPSLCRLLSRDLLALTNLGAKSILDFDGDGSDSELFIAILTKEFVPTASFRNWQNGRCGSVERVGPPRARGADGLRFQLTGLYGRLFTGCTHLESLTILNHPRSHNISSSL